MESSLAWESGIAGRDNSNPDPGRLMLVVIEHNEKAGCSMLYTRLSIS